MKILQWSHYCSKINNELDNAKVHDAQKRKHIKVYEEPDWKQQDKNQEEYLKSKNPLQLNN